MPLFASQGRRARRAELRRALPANHRTFDEVPSATMCSFPLCELDAGKTVDLGGIIDMARKTKRRKAGSNSRGMGWWRALAPDRRKRLLASCATITILAALAVSGGVALARLETHVSRALTRQATPVLSFIDLPPHLTGLAENDLTGCAEGLLEGDWMRTDLCQLLAERVAEVGWVSEVNFVRRDGTGRFEVSCRYRTPTAMVQKDDDFYLVDRHSVRLPGRYRYDPTWLLIQGAGQSAPDAGRVWPGGDVRTGLAVIDAVVGRSFVSQITAVLVDNVAGRRDRHHSHIELATDRAGGRIRWGSAPGFEMEENSVAEKLAILAENYRRTGRADAGHPVIDISLYPDRFTIPAQ